MKKLMILFFVFAVLVPDSHARWVGVNVGNVSFGLGSRDGIEPVSPRPNQSYTYEEVEVDAKTIRKNNEERQSELLKLRKEAIASLPKCETKMPQISIVVPEDRASMDPLSANNYVKAFSKDAPASTGFKKFIHGHKVLIPKKSSQQNSYEFAEGKCNDNGEAKEVYKLSFDEKYVELDELSSSNDPLNIKKCTDAQESELGKMKKSLAKLKIPVYIQLSFRNPNGIDKEAGQFDKSVLDVPVGARIEPEIYFGTSSKRDQELDSFTLDVQYASINGECKIISADQINMVIDSFMSNAHAAASAVGGGRHAKPIEVEREPSSGGAKGGSRR